MHSKLSPCLGWWLTTANVMLILLVRLVAKVTPTQVQVVILAGATRFRVGVAESEGKLKADDDDLFGDRAYE